jgi:hypothetical protein
VQNLHVLQRFNIITLTTAHEKREGRKKEVIIPAVLYPLCVSYPPFGTVVLDD